MPISFTLSTTFPVKAEELYNAWLNSEGHAAMTGGKANCSDQAGDSFTAWDGYISGTNKTLVPTKEIVQSWRTSEFDPEDPDSEIRISLTDTPEGCVLELSHTNIPDGQPDYKQGWEDHYFAPMRNYFSN